jgi:hypothetical protein
MASPPEPVARPSRYNDRERFVTLVAADEEYHIGFFDTPPAQAGGDFKRPDRAWFSATERL